MEIETVGGMSQKFYSKKKVDSSGSKSSTSPGLSGRKSTSHSVVRGFEERARSVSPVGPPRRWTNPAGRRLSPPDARSRRTAVPQDVPRQTWGGSTGCIPDRRRSRGRRRRPPEPGRGRSRALLNPTDSYLGQGLRSNRAWVRGGPRGPPPPRPSPSPSLHF